MMHGQTSFSDLMDVVPIDGVGTDADLFTPPAAPPDHHGAAIGEDIFAEALSLPPPPSMWDNSCFELELLDLETLGEPSPATPDVEFKPPAATDPPPFKLTCATPTKSNNKRAPAGQSSPRSVVCKVEGAEGATAAAKAPKAPKVPKLADDADDSTSGEEKKRMERMQRNRESAATSRKRKKEKVEELEGMIAQLDETARALKAQNAELRREIAEVRDGAAGDADGVALVAPALPKLPCATDAVAGSRAVPLFPTLSTSANSAAGA